MDRIYDNPRATDARIERAEQAAERYERNVLNLNGNYNRHRQMTQALGTAQGKKLKAAYYGEKYSVGEYRDGVNEPYARHGRAMANSVG